jgi:hypothetical protein
MGKYEPLTERLQSRGDEEWRAKFSQIEEVVGAPLPPSARKHREWWSNQTGQGHSQARGWQDAGWQVWKVDLASEEVVFRRRPRERSGSGAGATRPESDLFERAATYLGTDDRDAVVREALQALCEREAARRLARLGGAMPGLGAPPRRRSGE